MAHNGHLIYDREHVGFLSRNHAGWSLPVEEISVIGEVTTDRNIWHEPWSIVFVARGGEQFFTAPMNCVGRDAVCGRLAKKFGQPIGFVLESAHDYRSVVAWPPELKGEALFDFKRERGETLRDQILFRLFPKIRMTITEPIAAQLAYFAQHEVRAVDGKD